jgi:hypothetical protein
VRPWPTRPPATTLQKLRDKCPGIPVVTYVNTRAAVRAACGISDAPAGERHAVVMNVAVIVEARRAFDAMRAVGRSGTIQIWRGAA